MQSTNITQHHNLVSILSRFFDVIAVIFSSLIAFKIRFFETPFSEIPESYILMVVFAALLTIIMFPWFGVYKSWRGGSSIDQLRAVLLAWLVVWVSVIIALFSFKASADYSRIWLGTWFVVAFSVLFIVRWLIYSLLKSFRKRGYNQKKVVLFGAGELGREVIQRLNASKWAGFEVVQVYDDNQELDDTEIAGCKIVADSKNLEQYIQNNQVDEVWIALPLRAEDRVKEIMHELRHCLVNIKLLPDIFGMRLINHSVGEMLGFPIVNLSSTPIDGVNRLIKEIEDKLFSFIILILISPIMLILAIGVKLSSPGPVFYKQTRVGWNGKTFEMLKFRSMPVDVEKDGVIWGGAKNKTTSQFGVFIRKTSLDELPQFFNVLKGDMSIVGPRPERDIFVEKFKDEIPDYMKKHLVKAGVTGWAQINGWRGDTDLNKRIEYDMFYIENWSLWFDLKVILLTVFKGFITEISK